MLSKVFKYSLVMKTGEQRVTLPRGALVLRVAQQIIKRENVGLKLWALVDPGEPLVSRPFWLIETGKDVSLGPNARHISTLLLYGGGYVLHVFEDASWDAPLTTEVGGVYDEN